MNGYYYLHTNGDLIFKTYYPDDSDFVKKVWSFDTSERTDAWTIILEALALVGNKNRVSELILKWDCNLSDLVEYISRVAKPNSLQKRGLEIYFETIGVDIDDWCQWLASTPKGQEPNINTMPCNGFEIDSGLYSGCSGSGGDCPGCGR